MKGTFTRPIAQIEPRAVDGEHLRIRVEHRVREDEEGRRRESIRERRRPVPRARGDVGLVELDLVGSDGERRPDVDVQACELRRDGRAKHDVAVFSRDHPVLALLDAIVRFPRAEAGVEGLARTNGHDDEVAPVRVLTGALFLEDVARPGDRPSAHGALVVVSERRRVDELLGQLAFNGHLDGHGGVGRTRRCRRGRIARRVRRASVLAAREREE